jgi:hypothetical protein
MLDFGTDEKTIFSTMDKVSTKDDMLLVIKAFGMKQYLWGTRAAHSSVRITTWSAGCALSWARAILAKIKPKFDQWGIPL